MKGFYKTNSENIPIPTGNSLHAELSLRSGFLSALCVLNMAPSAERNQHHAREVYTS